MDKNLHFSILDYILKFGVSYYYRGTGLIVLPLIVACMKVLGEVGSYN